MSVEMEPEREQKKHKKSKSKSLKQDEETPADAIDIDQATAGAAKKGKKSKDKKRKVRSEDTELAAEAEAEPAASPEKKHKRHKSEDKQKKEKKRSKRAFTPTEVATVPDTKEYPFFTQTFSQRVPIWPAAFDEPLTKTAREYLDPMLNRYSPKYKGVLLAYKNVNLSHRPQRPNPNEPPTDDTPVALESFECYAPPFAWLTADLHLFVPSRGAWMEGEINLQSEGHIGVVCFEKFNASISRRSLPRGWQWVELTEEERAAEEAAAAAEEEDPFADTNEEKEGDGKAEEGEEGDNTNDGKPAKTDVPRLLSSGYWLDEDGHKVGGKVYFRIKNFSSGSTGDYTYLSLQGTMLDEEAEKEAAAEERAIEKARRARQNSSGLLYPTMRLPEFSMTKLKDDLV